MNYIFGIIGSIIGGFIGGIFFYRWWDKSIIEDKKADLHTIEVENSLLNSEFHEEKIRADELAEQLIKKNNKLKKLKAKAKKVKDEKCSDNIDDLLRQFNSKS